MVNGVDYRIPMSVKGLDLSGLASNYMAGQQNKRQNELLELTKKQKAQEMQHLDDENRFKSILKFGLQIKPYLDAGDIGGAQRVYSQRIQDIKSRGGNPSDSMELAPYLMSGDTEGAAQMVDSVVKAGERLGYLRGENAKPDFTLGNTRFDGQGNVIASVDEPKDKNKGFDQEGKLRGEFTKLSDDFRLQNAAFGRIQASVNNPSPAGDLALVFNFMKVLDPGSTVREGEFDNAASAKAELARAEEDGTIVPNFIKSAVDRLTKGTILLPEQRKDFYGRAQALYTDAKNQYSLLQDRYKNLSQAYELDPSRVIVDFATADPDKEINFGDASTEDAQAIEWAKANPNDPRAQKILQVNQ